MTELEHETEPLADIGSGTKAHVCPECGAEFRTKIGMGKHRRSEHDVLGQHASREQERPARKRKRPSRASLQADLAQAHFGICVAAVGFSNPQALAHIPAVDYLQEHSERWAAALAGVCEQDERVMMIVSSAMHAGVWLTFASATATSLVSVGVMSGRFQLPYGAVQLLAPKLIELQTVAQEQAATQNGHAGGDQAP